MLAVPCFAASRQRVQSRNASAIDLTGDWGFNPTGSYFRYLPVPGFYIWNRSPENGPYFDGENGPAWKFIEGYPEGVYTKRFDIPSSMSGKRIFLHFESVNYLADVYVNGSLVGSHTGGYVPFECDITSAITIPSSSNLVAVHIRYWDGSFWDHTTDLATWPVAVWGNFFNLGITGEVWIEARHTVYVENTFITTSVRNQTIQAALSIANAGASPRSLQLLTRIEKNGSTVKTIPARDLTVSARDTVEVSLLESWPSPVLWRPGQPALYEFVSELYENGMKVETSSTSFGFREFWIEGTCFYLNGVRQNLRGDNLDLYSLKILWQFLVPDPENWSAILDSLISLNFNVIRLHQEPVPAWMLDLCDQKGMLVIAESALHGCAAVPAGHPDYVAHSVRWMKEWIRSSRNHPSIVLWSASNEIGLITYRLSQQDIRTIGDAIPVMDPTRPVIFEGEHDLGGSARIYSYHYMDFFPSAWPAGSIYDYIQYVSPDKPTSWGEFDWNQNHFSRDTWVRRHALKTRLARTLNVADVRPFKLDWAWHPNPDFFWKYNDWHPTQEQVDLLNHSMNPIAVFDRAYYEFSSDPSPPAYNEGTSATRTFVFFNDDYEESTVEVRWRVILNGVVSSSGTCTVEIPLGSHVERPLTFKAPYSSADAVFQLELSTWKNGIQRFAEKTDFITRNIGLSPPAAVSSIRIERDNSTAVLSWSPVTANMEGGTAAISHYKLYRSGDCLFSTPGTDSVLVYADTLYHDALAGFFGNSSQNRFYRVVAVDGSGLASIPSAIVGEFDFSLSAAPPYRLNHIALPLSLGGVESAQDLLEEVPEALSVARWNAAAQGYEQYIPGIQATNFEVSMGGTYFITSGSAVPFTLLGEAVFPEFVLEKRTGSSFHTIMLPLDKPDLQNARKLYDNIPYCDGLAFWNVDIQGYEQYIPEVPPTDFPVQAGHPYFVSVSRSVTWPQGGAGKRIRVGSTVPGLSAQGSGRTPHAVWGRVECEGDSGAGIRWTAHLESRPDDRLCDTSPGCSMDRGIWIVQCGNLKGSWQAGDRLKIIFTGRNGEALGEHVQTLSMGTQDQAGVLRLKSGSIPAECALHPGFPNPFNGTATIPYELPERQPVLITVHNLLGQPVRILVQETQQAGSHQAFWDGKNEAGRDTESGLYIIRMQSGPFSAVQKMLLVR